MVDEPPLTRLPAPGQLFDRDLALWRIPTAAVNEPSATATTDDDDEQPDDVVTRPRPTLLDEMATVWDSYWEARMDGAERASLIIALIGVLYGRIAPSGPAGMIWYFLYPFRGTTEPPVLGPSHPLRLAFTRYALRTARHPVLTILFSVIIGALLVYPIPFLYLNRAGSAVSNLPHHVWTAAQPYEGNPNTREDVVMRSVWIHGSYMKALETHVLQTALDIQDALLGPTVNFSPRRDGEKPYVPYEPPHLSLDMRDSMHASNGLSNDAWFFHSPLLYWRCSAAELMADDDIIGTVNARPSQRTSVNITLRHSIVFSGKQFDGNRLVAADAIVLTLIHKLGSPVGEQWVQRAMELAAAANSDRWQVYPRNGISTASQLYDFRFQPLSLQDDLVLGSAYILTLLYFLLTLSRLRAVKSRVGLTVAVVVQIFISIMSSFTICAVFNINLSKIPREAYPLVVLAIGLENMFRLINAVLSTPSDHATASRISDALGKTGHVALAAVSQNLIILWVLAKVVSPGVAAFCTFTAIAILFDFFYLLTYFVAVLSVDVRRMELSDSLHRASTRHETLGTPLSRHSWVDSIYKGEAPWSTRVAGTLVMIGFIVMAQWHFFDEGFVRTLWKVFNITQPRKSTADVHAELNQARTPTSWLRLQDHETAHEVIQVIKPNAHSYLARVYDPVVVVINGADRRSPRTGLASLLPSLYAFAENHISFCIVIVLFVCGLVCLLMNYLLWDEVDATSDDGDGDSDQPLNVHSLATGHHLDIIKLASSADGIIVSVGLDRRIRVWDLKQDGRSYCVDTATVDPFPVLALAVDPTSTCLALLTAKGKIWFWDIPQARWTSAITVEIKGRPPLAFGFGRVSSGVVAPLLLVRHTGLMSEIHLGEAAITESQLCRSPLVVSRQFSETSVSSLQSMRVATASRSGCIHIASRMESGWLSTGIELPCPDPDNIVFSALPLPNLQSLLAIRKHCVELLDLASHRVMHTFNTQPIKPDTLHCIPSAPRMTCCGSIGLTSFSLVYTNAETDECVVQTYSPAKDDTLICFRNGGMVTDQDCNGWDNTAEAIHTVQNPGHWAITDAGVVIGVRKVPPTLTIHTSAFDPAGLRQRHVKVSAAAAEEDAWEAWMLTSKGESLVVPFALPSGFDSQLLVSSVGPMIKVGKSSMVVALGNALKFITYGTERFGNIDDDDAALGMASRRRRTNPARRRPVGE